MPGNIQQVLLGLAGREDRAKGSVGIWERIGDPGGGGEQSLLDGGWTSTQETEKQWSLRLCKVVVEDPSKLMHEELSPEDRGG